MKKIFLLLLLIIFFVIPLSAFGQHLNLSYPEFFGVSPGTGSFADFIAWLYYLIIIISSAAAFGAIVWGGVEYLTSGGNPVRMGSGLEKIKTAVIGLLIVLCSFLILRTISPGLVEFPTLEVPGFED